MTRTTCRNGRPLDAASNPSPSRPSARPNARLPGPAPTRPTRDGPRWPATEREGESSARLVGRPFRLAPHLPSLTTCDGKIHQACDHPSKQTIMGSLAEHRRTLNLGWAAVGDPPPSPAVESWTTPRHHAICEPLPISLGRYALPAAPPLSLHCTNTYTYSKAPPAHLRPKEKLIKKGILKFCCYARPRSTTLDPFIWSLFPVLPVQL